MPPVLKPREVIRILEKMGFKEVRQRGSHKRYRHPDGRTVTVPFHQGKDVAPSVLHRVVKKTGLTVDEFLAAK